MRSPSLAWAQQLAWGLQGGAGIQQAKEGHRIQEEPRGERPLSPPKVPQAPASLPPSLGGQEVLMRASFFGAPAVSWVLSMHFWESSLHSSEGNVSVSISLLREIEAQRHEVTGLSSHSLRESEPGFPSRAVDS